MSAWDALDELLRTGTRDAGCRETFALIHTYAEIVLAGGDPEEQMPGITAHLDGCGPCDVDYQGLLQALRDEVAGH